MLLCDCLLAGQAGDEDSWTAFLLEWIALLILCAVVYIVLRMVRYLLAIVVGPAAAYVQAAFMISQFAGQPRQHADDIFVGRDYLIVAVTVCQVDHEATGLSACRLQMRNTRAGAFLRQLLFTGMSGNTAAGAAEGRQQQQRQPQQTAQQRQQRWDKVRHVLQAPTVVVIIQPYDLKLAVTLYRALLLHYCQPAVYPAS